MSAQEIQDLLYQWPLWARKDQLPPEGDWRVWLICAGRAWGKTRTGSEWVKQLAESQPGCKIAAVGPTAASVRNVMVHGESGLLSVIPFGYAQYYPTYNWIKWPNGSTIELYSAEEPDRLRGFNGLGAWVDELCAFNLGGQDGKDQDGSGIVDKATYTWDMLQMGIRTRSVTPPRIIVTTTPKPFPLLREIMKSPGTVVTGGSTYENRANLSDDYIKEMERRYEGTRLGQQELHAKILDSLEGALFSRGMIKYKQPQ